MPEETTQVAAEQVVVFAIGEELFATLIDNVKEILKLEDITPVPKSPDYVAGIMSVRGQVVPVIELGVMLHIGAHALQEAYVLLVETEESGLVGVIVDQVIQIRYFDKEHIKEAPELIRSKVPAEFISGVILPEDQQNKDEVMLFVNLKAIITKSVADELQAVTSESQN